jgi:iron complex transport system substrate-binding protein
MVIQWLLLLFLVAVSPVAAAPPALLGPAQPLSLTDDAGRPVTIPTLSRRIISLAPSVTELLYALGAGEQLIAVTQACNYPPEAQGKPRLGFASSAVEEMILLRPDLVVGVVGMVKPFTIETLERRQIPLLLLEAKSLGDVYRHIRWLARATGRLVDADRLITHLEAQREGLKTRLGSVAPVPVFYVINDEPLVTVGPHTFMHQLLEVAGGRNIAAGATGAYPQFSLEEVLTADPAVILFDTVPTGRLSEAQRRFWQRWPTLRAVAGGRLLAVDSDLVSRPGPRIYEAAWYLAERLHPERFASGAGRQGAR